MLVVGVCHWFGEGPEAFLRFTKNLIILGDIDTNEVYYTRVLLAIYPKTKTGEPCRSKSGLNQVSE